MTSRLLALMLLVTACATAPNRDPAASADPGVATVQGGDRDRDVLLQAEMMQRSPNSTEVHDAVSRLRPHFLRTRGARTSSGNAPILAQTSQLKVYINDRYAGNAETLKSLRVEQVKEVRYLSASQATVRFGTGNTEGAIAVTLF